MHSISSLDCSSRLQAESQCHHDVEVEEGRKGEWLLELASNNDVRGLKAAVEEGSDVNECGRWYCRQVGSNKMGVVDRSPIMIAALFGSLEVLEYILAHSEPDHINKVCSADKSTVLHCAMASGASNTSQMVHLLLSHGADPSHVDSQGLCYLDLQIGTPGKANVTPSSIEYDGVDWKDILPDSVSVTSMADLDETWEFEDAAMTSDYAVSSSQMSSPKSEKGLKYKTLQDHSCDALSSDILKSSIYTTDEFRMYSFKVRPCSRAYSHDWTECPFVHPGENARRRDPRRFHYSCVPCPDFRKGACRHGDACEYAHGVFESWLHPAQYRTRLCKDGMSCTRKVCFFAHTKEEVRPLFLSTECGGTSPGPLSPVDVASSSSPSGAASPSAALRLASFSPVLGHSSFASSDKSLCDIWTPPSLPTLHLPERAQASRLRASLSARDINVSTLPDVDGQLMRELASLSAHARFNAAMAASSCSTTPSNNGKHQNVSLNLMSTNVEDPSSAGSPRSPLQMCLQFSPRIASKFHDTGLGRVASTALEDLVAAGVVAGSYPMQVHRLSQFQQSELGLNRSTEVFHQRSPLSAASSQGWDWGCPTGKKPEWGVSGDDLTHFRSSLNAAAHLLRLDADACAVKMG